ncbi:MAG: phytanoyl-CoA dioxygenase family protein [Candidatus Latescibacterota bacterium]|nr:phytanoyl-CoA dioxygenase family protein [Candidatus Latescibacterota bacterium]
MIERQQQWLENLATDEQLRHFDEQGYLIVEEALSPDMVKDLTPVVDRIDTRVRAERGLDENATMTLFRTVAEDDLFLELLDNPTTFPLAWDILGWNIQLYISHLIVYPPEPEGADLTAGGWHQDGGRPVREMERPHPRLSFKVSYWLSDTRVSNSGAMRIIPGSHRLDEKPLQEALDNPVHVEVAPGTAVLFDRRMWHARGINTSSVTRKVLFFGYSYRWLRGLDYNNFPQETLAKCDPIRRQILGDGIDVKGWWQPTEADTPLKSWIAEHRGEEYLLNIAPL